MAGGQERVLRRRIKSVQATKKITKAMELIAASQIVRSQGRIHSNKRFRDGMSRIVVEAAKGDSAAAKRLLGKVENPTSVAILAIVGDRGLSGSYNSSVFRTTERLINEYRKNGVAVKLFTVGKKAPSYFRFRGIPVEASYQGFADKPTFADARTIAAAIAAPFTSGEADLLLLVSTRFLSAGSQVVRTTQLLPLQDDSTAVDPAGDEVKSDVIPGYTEFEPAAARLLAELAPRAVESEVFAALLEGAASFFTAQQRAMAAATENAEELIRTLSRIMNRARQDAITTEIMEIVGGAEALRQPKGA